MANGLSTDKLEELRRQREEARAKKKAEEEKLRLEQEEKERAEQKAREKAEEETRLKVEKDRAEQERKEKERKAELERIEKEKAELKAQLEKEKQEKLENQKRHTEELAKEKEKQIEILKQQNSKVEKDKEKAVQEKNDEIKQLKEEKKSVEERLAAKEKRMLEKIKKEQKMANAKTEENSDEIINTDDEKTEDLVYASKVKVVDSDPVLAGKESDREEEEGKVQVGFTMVDKSLVNEAKDNKRYGIKDRGPVFRKVNTIVFYLAIPFMIIWAVLAFGGICTAKVGHTSFANTVYYKVNSQTALDGYSNGTILSVKAASLSDVKVNDKICVEFRNKQTGKKELHLLEVKGIKRDVINISSISIAFTIDNDNETLAQYNIVSGEEISRSLTGKDVRFMGIVSGRDIIIGSFLMTCQNIVGFIFIVVIPAAVILTFQFINLYDSIKLYVKQKKIANANKQKQKKDDNRDKIIK